MADELRDDTRARLNRREFMIAGTTSLLALDGGVKQQVETGDTGTEYQFQGVADLLGPDSARPEPGGEFFEDKIAGAYRYEATDTNKRYFIAEPFTTWRVISMNLEDYSTPYNALKTASQSSQFALDPSKGLTRRRYSWFSNNTLFDKTQFVENDANGTIDLSTGGTSATTARIHSSIAGQYLSQSVAQPGVGLDIADGNVTYDSDGYASLSHGTAAVGVGWHDTSAGGWGVGGPVQTFLGLRYASDGVYAELIANGSRLGDAPVPQSEWNLDTMDGTGGTDNPSGKQLRPDDGYVYQFPYTWYGHGALYVGVSHPDTGSIIYFHKFSVPETSFDRPNMPPLVLVDDGGTASDLTARLGGMQFALYGSSLGVEGTEERGLDVTRTNFDITTASVDNNGSVDPLAEPGEPILSFKRTDGVRDIAMRLDNLRAQVDANLWVFAWDEYDPATALTGANFRNPNEAVHPDDETLVEIDTAATDYTPTVAVSRGIDFISTDKNQASLQQLQTDDRLPIDATRVITAVDDGTDVSIDPAQVRIVEGY